MTLYICRLKFLFHMQKIINLNPLFVLDYENKTILNYLNTLRLQSST